VGCSVLASPLPFRAPVIGDKCAWITTGNQGASSDLLLSTGTYPVQSLWSNAFDGDAGGCVLSY
jgi:serine protease